MAPASRWSLSDPQTFAVGALIVAGVFILACGAGMANIAVGGLGVAVAVLGPLLIMVTGLRAGGREVAYGRAQVVGVSPPPAGGNVGLCEMDLLITAHGSRGVPAQVRDLSAPVDKWPAVGALLPVMVSVRDPREIRVIWEEVRPHRTVPAEAPADDTDPYRTDDTTADDTDPDDAWPGDVWPEADWAESDRPATDQPRYDEPENDEPENDQPENDQPGDGGSEVDPDAGPTPEAAMAPPAPAPREPAPNGGVSVTLIVSDLQRSLRFYRDTLGLAENDSARTTAVLSFGDARVVLRQVTDMPPIDRRLVHLNLDVPDVEDAYDRLRAKGVEFVHRPRVVQQGEHLELYSATFRDPDGHAIAITRWTVRR